ncbi:sulfotransferase, partial [Streptomyces sp. NPDC057654]|uniref:sulfotransferase n=1 Tax=Streptomyces sp. NPDC057654 TaxID=3346196 RepID=UPI0036B5E7B6
MSPPAAGRRVHLVLRTVGERTTDLALDLAVQHIRPHRVHIVDDVRPFWRAVDLMLDIDYGDASCVVFLDADCLILEDLRPFLDANELAFVECYVHDPFRGRVPCGVHIVRADVVRRMRRAEVRRDDVAWLLRPESTRLELALKGVQDSVQYRGAHILHDHFQHYDHVFAKIALRELRSRTEASRPVFAAAVAGWGQGPDHDVARAAVGHARSQVAESATGRDVRRYIERLPETSLREVEAMGLPDRPALTRRDVVRAGRRVRSAAGRRADRAKVFGLGLTRTGTRSLRSALHLLGYDVAHYPIDRASLDALARGDGRFPLLKHYDGLADVAAVPCFRELDALHRGAKFVLTVRDKASWLASL